MNRQPCRSKGPKKAGDLAVARVGSIDRSLDTASAILRRQATSLYTILLQLGLSSRRIDFPFLIQCMRAQAIVKQPPRVGTLCL